MTRKNKKISVIEKSSSFIDPELFFKEESIFANQPFHFPGTNGKAILLIHGWSSVPYEVRRLGRYLNGKGFTVVAPVLRGHGTSPRDLEGVYGEDWMQDARKAYQEMEGKHEKIYVGGTSMGANISLLLAKENPAIAGIILMATPYRMKLELLTVNTARVLNLFRKYNKKFYPPTFGAANTITRLVSYQTYPIVSALEAFSLIKKARKNLGKINQPCLIIQSLSDHVVARNSIDKIYAKIGSSVKKKKYIERAYHTFISDMKDESVFREIADFVLDN